MGKQLKENLLNHLVNAVGFKTDRRIIVIESDDWGSIRMPSRKVYTNLLKKGVRVDELCYNRYDSLASEEDLTFLFEILFSVNDKNGNPAKFTGNTIVANPDFDKIRESDFKEYYYEPFTETLKRYPKHQNSFKLWQEGISSGVFKPQFHGREHLNVLRWMEALKENYGYARLAFDFRMYDLSTKLKYSENSFMESLNYNDDKELWLQKNYINEGTQLFELIFGYRSASFIAPCYIWGSDLNETLKNSGINIIQGSFYQFQPTEGKLKKIIHYTGQKNSLGQYHLVRNVSFEPSENLSHDWVCSAMSQISNAFSWRKPAIISSHRMNYIGFIDPDNRNRNLILLSRLLKNIKKKWPDVEFMSSDQLGQLIRQNSE